MGGIKHSESLNQRIYENAMIDDHEALIDRVSKYVDIKGKTIDEVLDSLDKVDAKYEDYMGAAQRLAKYTRGKGVFSKETEDRLVIYYEVRDLIYRVNELKKWLNEE